MKAQLSNRTDARFLARTARLRSRLPQGYAYLVFLPENLRYLCDYTGEAAYGVLTPQHFYLITDYRFEQQALSECVHTQVVCRNREQQSLGQAIAEILQSEHIQQAVIETHALTHQMYTNVVADNTHIQWVAAQSELVDMRSVKDDFEIHATKHAAKIADAALEKCLPLFKPGISELDFALELEYQMRKMGSEGVSFPVILGFGARSALPHCPPSANTLKEGDLIVLDFGAVYQGYRSDMTRTYVLGKASSQQQAMYQAVWQAQEAALAHLRAGAQVADANLAANHVLQESDFSAYASNGLGHGVGLQLHEYPLIYPHTQHTLQAGQIITVEPGIYLAGYGGVRIEDDVLITDTGFECLTHAHKVFELPV